MLGVREEVNEPGEPEPDPLPTDGEGAEAATFRDEVNVDQVVVPEDDLTCVAGDTVPPKITNPNQV